MSSSSSIDFWHRVLLLGDEFWVLRDDADAEIERLRGLVDACSIFLKEDETPAQRIERERADTEAVLKLLLKEKRDNERLRKELAEKDDYIKTVSRPVGAHSYE